MRNAYAKATSMIRASILFFSLFSLLGFMMACNPKQMGKVNSNSQEEREFEARVKEMIKDLDHVEQSELLPEIDQDSKSL